MEKDGLLSCPLRPQRVFLTEPKESILHAHRILCYLQYIYLSN